MLKTEGNKRTSQKYAMLCGLLGTFLGPDGALLGGSKQDADWPGAPVATHSIYVHVMAGW